MLSIHINLTNYIIVLKGLFTKIDLKIPTVTILSHNDSMQVSGTDRQTKQNFVVYFFLIKTSFSLYSQNITQHSKHRRTQI